MRHVSYLCAALCIATLACGSDSDSQPAARQRVMTSACDYFQRCNDIGAGKMYTSRENCETQQAAVWESALPPTDCDGKIDSSALDVCLTTIGTAECGNGADFLNVVLNKCTKVKICAGATKP